MSSIRSVVSFAPVLVLPALLAACTAAPPPQGMKDVSQKAASGQPPSSDAGGISETPGASAEQPEPAQLEQAVSPPDSKPAEQSAAPTAKTLPSLMGLEDGRIIALLGKPDLQWPEGRVAIWQYDDGRCVLRLYMAEKDGSRRLSYMQAHWPDRGSGTPRQCAENLFARKNETAIR